MGLDLLLQSCYMPTTVKNIKSITIIFTLLLTQEEVLVWSLHSPLQLDSAREMWRTTETCESNAGVSVDSFQRQTSSDKSACCSMVR